MRNQYGNCSAYHYEPFKFMEIKEKILISSGSLRQEEHFIVKQIDTAVILEPETEKAFYLLLVVQLVLVLCWGAS